MSSPRIQWVGIKSNLFGSITIDFEESVKGVAPGQVAAIWYQKWCMGSGVIEQTWTQDEMPSRTLNDIKRAEYEQAKVRRVQEAEEDAALETAAV